MLPFNSILCLAKNATKTQPALYKAIIAATAIITANTLPPSAFSCPILSAPLLVDVVEEPPCENPDEPELEEVLALPLAADVAVDPDAVVAPDAWALIPAGSPPEIPGTVSAVAVAEDEAAVPVPLTGAPASMSRPVPSKDASTVALLLSTTVLLVPA